MPCGLELADRRTPAAAPLTVATSGQPGSDIGPDFLQDRDRRTVGVIDAVELDLDTAGAAALADRRNVRDEVGQTDDILVEYGDPRIRQREHHEAFHHAELRGVLDAWVPRAGPDLSTRGHVGIDRDVDATEFLAHAADGQLAHEDIDRGIRPGRRARVLSF